MEMTAGYPGQSALPIKMMAISDVENAHPNRHPPVSASYSVGHGSNYGNSNGKLKIDIIFSCVLSFLVAI